MIDISSALSALRRLPVEVEAATITELTGIAGDLQSELQGTRAHGDDTGALRSSYRVYVVHQGDDGSNAASDGAGAAEALNTGRGVVERSGEIGDDVLLVASGFTDYLGLIATESGGAKDAVTGLLPRVGPALTQSVASAIARRLG
jgi:hypothetical protein